MNQKYQIIRKLPAKKCQMFLATDKLNGKQVAIKKVSYADMNSKQKQQLVQQVNSLSEIKSNHIVKYYQHFNHKSQLCLYIVMEYCKTNLEDFLFEVKKQGKILSQNLIWNIFMQIVLGLNDVHHSLKSKIIHRNIKPSNIFGQFDNPNGQVKLGDFGLMRKLKPEENFSTTFVQDTFYLSPEQLEKGVFTIQTDIWALGCLLYQLAALKHPFTGTNQFQITKKIRQGKISSISINYSKELERVIRISLRKNPQERLTANQLLRIPQINFRLKQKRNAENYKRIKSLQTYLLQKEKQLDLLQQQINQTNRQSSESRKKISFHFQKQQNISLNTCDNVLPLLKNLSSQWYTTQKRYD